MRRRDFIKTTAAIAAGASLGANLTFVRADDAPAAKSAKNYKIAFSHPVSEAPVVTAIRKFASERAGELGLTALFDNTKSGQIESQVATIEAWITEGVDAICVLPLAATALKGLQEKAKQKRIVWTTYALPMDGQDGELGWDNKESGRLVGEHCARWITANKPDSEALILTLRALPGVSGRTDEPIRIIGALPKAKVVATQDAADPAKGLQVTEDTMQAHPNLNVVIGLNDDGALGAYRAFTNAKKDPKTVYVAGQDGALEALVKIKEGGIYKASGALPIRDVGRGVIDLNYGLLTGTGPKVLQVPVVLASLDDPAKLDELIAQWKNVT
jgi:ribose transport system substrate-binding protein